MGLSDFNIIKYSKNEIKNDLDNFSGSGYEEDDQEYFKQAEKILNKYEIQIKEQINIFKEKNPDIDFKSNYLDSFDIAGLNEEENPINEYETCLVNLKEKLNVGYYSRKYLSFWGDNEEGLIDDISEEIHASHQRLNDRVLNEVDNVSRDIQLKKNQEEKIKTIDGDLEKILIDKVSQNGWKIETIDSDLVVKDANNRVILIKKENQNYEFGEASYSYSLRQIFSDNLLPDGAKLIFDYTSAGENYGKIWNSRFGVYPEFIRDKDKGDYFWQTKTGKISDFKVQIGKGVKCKILLDGEQTKNLENSSSKDELNFDNIGSGTTDFEILNWFDNASNDRGIENDQEYFDRAKELLIIYENRIKKKIDLVKEENPNIDFNSDYLNSFDGSLLSEEVNFYEKCLKNIKDKLDTGYYSRKYLNFWGDDEKGFAKDLSQDIKNANEGVNKNINNELDLIKKRYIDLQKDNENVSFVSSKMHTGSISLYQKFGWSVVEENNLIAVKDQKDDLVVKQIESNMYECGKGSIKPKIRQIIPPEFLPKGASVVIDYSSVSGKYGEVLKKRFVDKTQFVWNESKGDYFAIDGNGQETGLNAKIWPGVKYFILFDGQELEDVIVENNKEVLSGKNNNNEWLKDKIEVSKGNIGDMLEVLENNDKIDLSFLGDKKEIFINTLAGEFSRILSHMEWEKDDGSVVTPKNEKSPFSKNYINSYLIDFDVELAYVENNKVVEKSDSWMMFDKGIVDQGLYDLLDGNRSEIVNICNFLYLGNKELGLDGLETKIYGKDNNTYHGGDGYDMSARYTVADSKKVFYEEHLERYGKLPNTQLEYSRNHASCFGYVGSHLKAQYGTEFVREIGVVGKDGNTVDARKFDQNVRTSIENGNIICLKEFDFQEKGYIDIGKLPANNRNVLQDHMKDDLYALIHEAQKPNSKNSILTVFYTGTGSREEIESSSLNTPNSHSILVIGNYERSKDINKGPLYGKSGQTLKDVIMHDIVGTENMEYASNNDFILGALKNVTYGSVPVQFKKIDNNWEFVDDKSNIVRVDGSKEISYSDAYITDKFGTENGGDRYLPLIKFLIKGDMMPVKFYQLNPSFADISGLNENIAGNQLREMLLDLVKINNDYIYQNFNIKGSMSRIQDAKKYFTNSALGVFILNQYKNSGIANPPKNYVDRTINYLFQTNIIQYDGRVEVGKFRGFSIKKQTVIPIIDWGKKDSLKVDKRKEQEDKMLGGYLIDELNQEQCISLEVGYNAGPRASHNAKMQLMIAKLANELGMYKHAIEKTRYAVGPRGTQTSYTYYEDLLFLDGTLGTGTKNALKKIFDFYDLPYNNNWDKDKLQLIALYKNKFSKEIFSPYLTEEELKDPNYKFVKGSGLHRGLSYVKYNTLIQKYAFDGNDITINGFILALSKLTGEDYNISDILKQGDVLNDIVNTLNGLSDNKNMKTMILSTLISENGFESKWFFNRANKKKVGEMLGMTHSFGAFQIRPRMARNILNNDRYRAKIIDETCVGLNDSDICDCNHPTEDVLKKIENELKTNTIFSTKIAYYFTIDSMNKLIYKNKTYEGLKNGNNKVNEDGKVYNEKFEYNDGVMQIKMSLKRAISLSNKNLEGTIYEKAICIVDPVQSPSYNFTQIYPEFKVKNSITLHGSGSDARSLLNSGSNESNFGFAILKNGLQCQFGSEPEIFGGAHGTMGMLNGDPLSIYKSYAVEFEDHSGNDGSTTEQINANLNLQKYLKNRTIRLGGEINTVTTSAQVVSDGNNLVLPPAHLLSEYGYRLNAHSDTKNRILKDLGVTHGNQREKIPVSENEEKLFIYAIDKKISMSLELQTSLGGSTKKTMTQEYRLWYLKDQYKLQFNTNQTEYERIIDKRENIG